MKHFQFLLSCPREEERTRGSGCRYAAQVSVRPSGIITDGFLDYGTSMGFNIEIIRYIYISDYLPPFLCLSRSYVCVYAHVFSYKDNAHRTHIAGSDRRNYNLSLLHRYTCIYMYT